MSHTSDDHIACTISTYNRIADSYSVDMNDYAPEVERMKFIALLPQQGSILDLGCAAGRDSEYFSTKGFRVVGVDLSEKLLAIAKKRLPQIIFLKQDIRHLQFLDGSFDGIWACAILLHLKRKEVPQVVARCYELLKPGGIMFLMMKKGEGEIDIAEKLSSGESRHFTLLQSKEINQMVKAAGFHLIETYTWNSKDRYSPSRDVEWISCFAKKEIV